MRLGIIVLAAGASSRMGQPKLLLPWGSTSILGHLVELWRGLGAEQVAVVCAPSAPQLEAEMQRLGFPAQNRIVNPIPEAGMFSSIQTAARWRGWKEELTHWVVVLGDQPHLALASLCQLLAFAAGHPQQICQPARVGHGRHPVVLPRDAFESLATSGQQDLRGFLNEHRGRIALLDSDDPGLELDLDTPSDYAQAVKQFLGHPRT
jgi:molybdenum cofactor cytidylyltransferase